MFNTSPAHILADHGDTITRMDALSQSGFGAIAAIAKRALAGLEVSRDTHPHTEALAAVLDVIWSKAEQFGNDINVKAEQAGCNWVGRR